MRNRTSAIFMALILALAGVASAQVSNTGTISVVVSDPDGVLVVPGVSAGGASFRLASSGVWYDALAHGRSQAPSAR